MATKTIPFDLETAKKIQAGEIEGKIKTAQRYNARIVCWDRMDTETPIIVLVRFGDWERIFECSTKGEYMEGSDDDAISKNLVLEVPDNEPQYQFQPFDKVLVRENDASLWKTGIYSHELDGKHFVSWNYFKQCIPYEGNEHLLGTTDKPKEKLKQ